MVYKTPQHNDAPVDAANGDENREVDLLHDKVIEEYRALALEDLWFFATEVLYADVAHIHYYEPLHRPLCEWVGVDTFGARKLVLLPRGCRKSYLVTVANSVWRIIRDPNVRIILVSALDDTAQQFCQMVKRQFQYNEQFLKYFPEFRVNKNQQFGRTYDFKHPLRKDTSNLMDPTFRSFYLGAPVAGRRCDVLLCDDMVEKKHVTTPEQADKALKDFNDLIPIVDKTGKYNILTVVGCLTANAQVLMADGTYKPIAEIHVGESVWAPATDGSISTRKVEAVIPQGPHKTVTVITTAHTISATPNHPFLTVSHEQELVWKRADELRVNELVISVKAVPGALIHEWMDEEFFWFAGFMLGDGWVGRRLNREYVCVAASKYPELNDRAVANMKEWFYADVRLTPFGYYRTDCAKAAEGMRDLGLSGTAKTKRVPSWAFMAPPTHRLALLRGICESDGTRLRGHDIYAVELSNKELVEDIRALADLCGIRHGILTERTREIKAPNSKRAVIATTYRTSLNLATVERHEMWQATTRTAFHQHLRPERVKCVVENVVEEPVYDLTVEGVPAFFANGLAVHNTRWSHMDVYGAILGEDRGVEVDKELRVSTEFESMVRHCLELPDGSAVDNPVTDGEPILPTIWPRELLLRELDQYRTDVKSGEEDWWKQYMNICISPAGRKFEAQYFDTWIPSLPGGVVFSFIVIDSATKDEQILMRGDFTVALACHFDAYGHLYVTDGFRSDRMKGMDLIEQLIAMNQRGKDQYGISLTNLVKEKVGEDTFFGWVRSEFNRAKLPLTIFPVQVRGQGKKYVRIVESLQHPAQARQIHFVQTFPTHLHQVLIDEAVHLGQWSHDDTVDALSLAFHPDIRRTPRQSEPMDWKLPTSARISQISTPTANPAALQARLSSGPSIAGATFGWRVQGSPQSPLDTSAEHRYTSIHGAKVYPSAGTEKPIRFRTKE